MVQGGARAAAEESPAPSSRTRWQWAQEQWRQGDLAAGFGAWRSLDPRTADGQVASRRLSAAAEHYRRAIVLLESGEPGARQELQRGKALAPMDPALYLPLARACRGQENLFLAVQYYRGYLGQLPGAPDAGVASQELALLERELGSVAGVSSDAEGDGDGVRDGLRAGGQQSRPARLLVPSVVGLLVGTALGLVLATVMSSLMQRRRRGRSLAELAVSYPELQPALAYLIGRLRHELLKHRIGAATEVTRALARGDSDAAQREFLRHRLYGGERLDEAWSGYVQSFHRALGPEFDLVRSDRDFADAQRAIHELQALEQPLLRGEPAAVRKLVSAHERLQRFDRGLAALLWRLQRTPVDLELLTAAVESVRSEHLAGQVVLDVVEIEGPAEPVTVAVYRTDLLLILKNLIRNAILAVGRAPAPRQIAIDTALEILPTGEEIVRVRVHDTNPEPLSPEQIYGSHGSDAEAVNVQHGLGLVTAALSLYSGSIAVLPGRSGYRKCVAVQLFRALDDSEAASGSDTAVDATAASSEEPPSPSPSPLPPSPPPLLPGDAP